MIGTFDNKYKKNKYTTEGNNAVFVKTVILQRILSVPKCKYIYYLIMHSMFSKPIQKKRQC